MLESLDTFKGSIPTLWRLGLPSQCRVRDLEVCDKDTKEDPDMTAEMLHDVLCAARPARLDLTICYSDTLGTPATGVADALVEACGATLEEFELTVEVTPPEDGEEYTSLYDVMVSVTIRFRPLHELTPGTCNLIAFHGFRPQLGTCCAGFRGWRMSLSSWHLNTPDRRGMATQSHGGGRRRCSPALSRTISGIAGRRWTV